MKYLSSLMSFYLGLLIILQISSRSVLYIWKSMDNASFVRVLCINKDYNRMCSGSCLLTSLISRAEDSSIPEHLIFELDLNYFLESYSALDTTDFNIGFKMPLFEKMNFSYFLNLTVDIFHPPQIGSGC